MIFHPVWRDVSGVYLGLIRGKSARRNALAEETDATTAARTSPSPPLSGHRLRTGLVGTAADYGKMLKIAFQKTCVYAGEQSFLFNN